MRPLLTVLDGRVRLWNPNLLSHSGYYDDAFHSTGAIVQGVSEALEFPHLVWYCHYIFAVSRVADRAAGWLEGCRCHPHMFQQKQSKRARLDRCTWAGRRGVEMAVGHSEEIVEQFRQAGTTGMSDVLGRTPPSVRADALQDVDRAFAVFSEWMTQTLFWQHWPFKAMRLLAAYFGGTLAMSKRTGVELLAWFDASPLESPCHRALLPLVYHGGAAREQLEMYIQVDRPLHMSIPAFRYILSLGFALLVHWRLEGVRSIFGTQSTQAHSTSRLP